METIDPCLIRAAEQMLAGRRSRDVIFGADRDGFGEPGWDMLLALFIGEAAGQPMSRYDLIVAAAVSFPATADRYLEWLCARELAVNCAGGICLGDRGRQLMIAYLERET